MQSSFIFFSLRNFRDPKSKWYATKAQYPHKTYPPYLPGTLHVFSAAAAAQIAAAAPNVPFFHIDDVYTTGFVAHE